MPKTPHWLGITVSMVAAIAWATPRTAGQREAPAQRGTSNGEWRYYGGDAAGTRYAPLDQINRNNVRDVRIAWRWQSQNFGARPEFNWEATPLMIGGVLYVTTGIRRDVVAIDAATGETLWMWRYNEGTRGTGPRLNHRGLSYWTDGRADERIVYVTSGFHLIELNAKTGQPITSFGQAGIVDLYEGLDRPRPKDNIIGSSTPPTIVGDIIVVGPALSGGFAASKENIAGFVRGYDVRTGKRVWIFHTIPTPGEVGNDTWEDDSWSYTGNTGVWGVITADEELGYIYLPVESPTNDEYGGHRPGNNVFGSSLVCLDAKTGRRIWHYQLVHHDIWDYDNPTAPILVDLTVGGRTIKAVVQVTKQSFAFVFDRVTGQPVWPIEERPVPKGEVPGEWYSPTQPFPTKPPPFDRQGMTVDDLIDFTPEIKARALAIASQYKMGPLYEPQIVSGAHGLKAMLQLPHAGGGANWQGGSVDPETGILYVSSATNPAEQNLVHDAKRSTANFVSNGGPGGFGHPDMKMGCGMIGPQGLPLVKPPWGRITAIDLNMGTQLWMQPLGDTPDCIKNHPLLQGVNVPKTGKPERA
ncbi:MAG TPA: PQQ-binding-like beta-propeller repeat protein, partial [Vicinamibacterales bacterium]|nr:PQQ-binding-like beta-propeller repeat protein [Vicinamibacterales bacterium]